MLFVFTQNYPQKITPYLKLLSGVYFVSAFPRQIVSAILKTSSSVNDFCDHFCWSFPACLPFSVSFLTFYDLLCTLHNGFWHLSICQWSCGTNCHLVQLAWPEIWQKPLCSEKSLKGFSYLSFKGYRVKTFFFWKGVWVWQPMVADHSRLINMSYKAAQWDVSALNRQSFYSSTWSPCLHVFLHACGFMWL